jgi:heat shock protein HslJ
MKNTFITIVVISIAIIFYGYYIRNQSQGLTTMFIAPVTVECAGVSPQRCLQVKYHQDEAYQNLYSPISGFEFQPGIESIIKVSTQEIINPPADSSSISYQLDEVVSQTPVNFIMITNPQDFTNHNSSTPLRVSGIGRGLFEGNVVVRAVDPQTNQVLSQGITTMSAINPEDQGNWSIDLDLNDIDISTIRLTASSPSPKENEVGLNYSLLVNLIASSPSISLQSNPWQLVTLNNQSPTVSGATITANFDESRITGSSGCNSYFGPYTTQNNNIEIGQISSTLKACIGDVANLEKTYLSLLTQANSYLISGQTLTLFNDNQQPILVFQTTTPIALENTPWQATGINNGRGGVESTNTTNLSTALFQNGTITGTSGCNSYTGNYQSDDQKSIKIEPLSTTRKSCPSNLMTQEQQFLTSLENTNRYQISEEQLTLFQDQTTMINFISNSESN